MSTKVTVPFWPQNVDNICWSADNLIAVAGTEQVAILVPKTKGTSKNESKWECIVFKVNTYTARDLIVLESLSFKHWRPSEELCMRFVENLQWSPAGLGIFGSCCLAILHADYSVDIWECRGRPEDKQQWQKALTLNGTIYDFYADRLVDDETAYERVQAAQRIQAMAWQPDASQNKRHSQRLAIITEAGDVFILRITAPYDILAPPGQKWTVDIESYFSVMEHIARTVAIDQLLWLHENGPAATFVLLTGQALHRFDTALIQAETMFKLDTSYTRLTSEDSRVEGPVKASNDGLTLFYFVDDTVVMHDMQTKEQRSQDMDRQWSELSGLSLVPRHNNTLFEVYPMRQSALETQATVRYFFSRKSHIELDMQQQSSVLDSLARSIKVYLAREQLHGTAHTRTFGAATSPLSSHIAYCTVMLPAQAPSHVIQGDQVCEIFINYLPGFESEDEIWQRPVESSVSTLQDHIAVTGAQVDEEWLTVAIDKLVKAVQATNHDRAFSSQQIQALRARVLQTSERYHELQQNLKALITLQPRQAVTPAQLYLSLVRAAISIFGSPEQCSDQLSSKTLAIHAWLQTRLQIAQDAAPAVPVETQESCSVCGQDIAFEALKWARCQASHRFTRCALSLLVIPRPEVRKQCILCGTQYLNEYLLPGLQSESSTASNGDTHMENGHTETDTAMAEISPLRMLFAAFDRCLFCNGRFVTG